MSHQIGAPGYLYCFTASYSHRRNVFLIHMLLLSRLRRHGISFVLYPYCQLSKRRHRTINLHIYGLSPGPLSSESCARDICVLLPALLREARGRQGILILDSLVQCSRDDYDHRIAISATKKPIRGREKKRLFFFFLETNGKRVGIPEANSASRKHLVARGPVMRAMRGPAGVQYYSASIAE